MYGCVAGSVDERCVCALRMRNARTARALWKDGRYTAAQASASRVVALTLLRFGGTVLLAPHDSAYVAGLDLMAAASSADWGARSAGG